MSNYMDEAKAMRASIAGLAEGASDEKIIDNKSAFPFWNGGGVVYKRGDIVQYLDKVYRVLLDHVSQLDWTPIVAVSLFVEIQVCGGIPDWVQPSSTNPYMKGDKVKHLDKIWISDVDNNVWEPSVYGWSEVEPNAD